jgi:hypothetical protein
MELSAETLESVRKSYFNILAFFLSKETIDTRYVRCLLKWGFQLGLQPGEINRSGEEWDQVHLNLPEERLHRLEEIYHLVSMIHLDKVVEDVELEVASLYAQRLGFKPSLVPDLFKSIATAVYDGAPAAEVRREVLEFLKLNGI